MLRAQRSDYRLHIPYPPSLSGGPNVPAFPGSHGSDPRIGALVWKSPGSIWTKFPASHRSSLGHCPGASAQLVAKMLAHYYNLMIPADATVLEIGCGSGELLARIRRSQNRYRPVRQPSDQRRCPASAGAGGRVPMSQAGEELIESAPTTASSSRTR